MKKIVFRVDSGNHIGNGHIMRCLTLAGELERHGLEIHFITKNHLGFAYELISKKYPVTVLDGGLKAELPLELKNNYQSWLGESWQEDLEKTNAAIRRLGDVQLVILDHYAFDEKYEKQLLCNKVMVIDDLMDRMHCCDFLLDQNTSADPEQYKKLATGKETKFFLGPKYALLRSEFSEYREARKKGADRKFKIQNIVVFFGSADVKRNCLKLSAFLTEVELSRYHFTFILNHEHDSFKQLKSWAAQHPASVTLIPYVENMAKTMSENDFFIGAGGSTSWEKICLGVPSAIVAVADNQVKISESLEALGLVYYLGKEEDVDSVVWRNFFDKKLPDLNYFEEMSSRCFNFMDGNGARMLGSIIVEDLR